MKYSSKSTAVMGLALVAGLSLHSPARGESGVTDKLSGNELIVASKLDGASALDFSTRIGTQVEGQLLVDAIRKQLYYNEADSVSAEAEDPQGGVYSRDNAAFRYLDLMYSLDGTSEEVINSYLSSVSPKEFSDLYGDPERARTSVAEALIYEQLELYPTNLELQQSLLDLYYDRAVAEIVHANIALDKALSSRLNGELAAIEIEHVGNAFTLLNSAFVEYVALVENTPTYLQQLTSSRGQVSPRYYDSITNTQNDVAPAGVLPGEYKDITLLYQLMSNLAAVKVQQAGLLIESDQLNSSLSTQMIDEILSLQNTLVAKEAELRTLFSGTDFTEVSSHSGLPQAVEQWHFQLDQLENAMSWLAGDTNFLGMSKLAVPHGFSSDTHFDAFNILSEFLDREDTGFIVRAESNLAAAKLDYDNYLHNAQALTDAYIGRHELSSNKLYSLLGARFPSSCYEKNCVDITSEARDNSEVAAWSRNVESVQNSITLSLQRLDNRLAKIELEVERLAQDAGVADGFEKIVVDYHSQQSSLGQQINRIRQKQEVFNSHSVLFESLSIAAQNYMSSSWDAVGELSDRLVAVNNSIDTLDDFTLPEAANVTLAAEHRASLYDSSGKILQAGSQYRLESLWLEVNAIVLELAQSEATLVQEAKRLSVILNQAKSLIAVATSDAPMAAQRYFADLIYSRRITETALKATSDFDRAQQWLFYTAEALEYKWQKPFAVRDVDISKGSVFHLRSAGDMWDFYGKMMDFDSPGIATSHQERDVFSIKEDVFGYRDSINGREQTYLHPDPNQQNGPRLSAREAFQEQLKLLARTFGSDTWVTIEFSTVKEPVRSDLFTGPIISEVDGESCIAVAGAYGDKIETVELNIPILYSTSGEVQTPAYLTYGGASVVRDSLPGNEVITDEGAAGVEGEFNTYSALFWDAAGLSQLAAVRNSYRVPMSAALDVFGSGAGSINTVTNKFKERSVAATGWRLSFLLEDIYGSVVDVEAIRDVELIFEHRFKASNYSSCAGGDPSGPL
ncbi:hypothetical protein [Microbulbifer sp. ANSA005]|uniref:hypothetical protein n=1 Tax=Microbulbifer sp. ANSA005 TaxID=3243362 RepID=UPI0040431386